MLWDEDKKESPIPMEDLIKKPGRGTVKKKALWQGLIEPTIEVPASKSSQSAKNVEKTQLTNVSKEAVQNVGSKTVQKRFKGGLEIVQEQFKSGSEAVQNVGSKTVQIDIGRSIASLRGNGLKCLTHIVSICRDNCDRITPYINLKVLAEELSMPWQSVRTCIRRLRTAKLLVRIHYTHGPNATVQYHLPEEVYRVFNERLNRIASLKEAVQNEGSKTVQSALCSSNYLITTTTENPKSGNEVTERILDDLDGLTLKSWGITKAHLLPYVGPGRICETLEDLEEFLHRVEFVISDIEKNGKKVKSRAGFLISRLKGEPIGLPEGYVSLKEKRLKIEADAKKQELEKIRAAKKEKYLVEFEIFKESVDDVTRSEQLKSVEGSIDINRSVVGNNAYERAVHAKFEERLKDLFVQQYEPSELRVEVLSYITNQ